MYNKNAIENLVEYISRKNGINNKDELKKLVKNEFNLTVDRSIFYCKDFAIRFSKSETKNMSNCVVSLSKLQKYDDRPFIVCIVASDINYMLLANTTFIKKVSHSSKQLRVDNIKGTILGNDIMKNIDEFENKPPCFKALFEMHIGYTFEENLERLVETTNNIVARKNRFNVDNSKRKLIIKSINRAQEFNESKEYKILKDDLDTRVMKVQNEIVIAAFIDNVNIRGRIIEYLITNNGCELKDMLIDSLKNGTPLPNIKTEDKLGDYSRKFDFYDTETDIKTKVMFLDGNPKAYNIDKLLEFLSKTDSIYMIYLVGINERKQVIVRFLSLFDERLIEATNIVSHWSGRNSRGSAQFIGHKLMEILTSGYDNTIDENKAIKLIDKLIML